MATEITEDTLEIEIGLLEAELFAADGHLAGYPYPSLTVTPQKERRTFRVVILENPYLRLTVVPELGGRILRVLDKRTGIEILGPSDSLRPVAGGPRGAELHAGIELVLTDESRLNSLGTVAYRIEEASEDDEPGSVWIGEICGNGLSFNARIALPPNRASFFYEARILNRTFEHQPYCGGLRLHQAEGLYSKQDSGVTWFSEERQAAIVINAEGQYFDGVQFEEGVLTVRRFHSAQHLAPRQADSWIVELTPFSGLGGFTDIRAEVAACYAESTFRMQVAETRLAHKLVMQTEQDETLEAEVNLYPETMYSIDLAGSQPERFALLDASKKTLLWVETKEPLSVEHAMWMRPGEMGKEVPFVAPPWLHPDEAVAWFGLNRATALAADRPAALTLLGMRALSEDDPQKAADAFEQALLYNADDPLLWWTRALALRLAGQGLDERPELLNAHFLAPLEPALRAESFLSQTELHGKDPSPLLAPLEETPEAFIEVACLLLECGLFEQTAKWIDEALRHVDLPMLRYLQAYVCILTSQMAVDAAEQVRAAGATPVAPPYPWRPIERTALAGLAEVFPGDKAVAERLALVNRLEPVFAPDVFTIRSRAKKNARFKPGSP